ncbi:MAG TPA: arsenic resistance N-acetyltransferase ArsN2 [Flavisolibacter sp.]|nr:arsenic resistance N-acetyltransferase ArsN2 [Flavisolibacter sp.]
MSTISPASKEEQQIALQLLQTANLPVEDINKNVLLYLLKEDGSSIGTIGMEHDGRTALLRSLSVEPSKRGKGYGEELVAFLEATAREKGILAIYLLTTTATRFFLKRGYAIINRSEAPAFIQQTSEFVSICPSSATVMKKELA